MGLQQAALPVTPKTTSPFNPKLQFNAIGDFYWCSGKSLSVSYSRGKREGLVMVAINNGSVIAPASKTREAMIAKATELRDELNAFLAANNS